MSVTPRRSGDDGLKEWRLLSDPRHSQDKGRHPQGPVGHSDGGCAGKGEVMKMIRFEIWFHPKHWNTIPQYEDLGGFYRVQWLMFCVEFGAK